VIILGTAFGGAWTIIVGTLALLGDKTALNAAAAGDVWVAYPMAPAPGQWWVPYAWIVLGLTGTLVQMFVTGGQGGRVVKPNKKKKPASE
jgi:endo-1,4-beta-D-glucanase Y